MSAAVGTMDIFKSRTALIVGGAVIAVACLALLGKVVFADQGAWKENISAFLEQARGTPWALPLVCATYVLSGFLFFPVMLLNLVCALVFGLWGILYAVIGGLCNVAVFFGIGYFLRHRGGEKWLKHPKLAVVDEKLKDSGIAGTVVVHMLPVPPYAVTNFLAGLSSIGFPTFMIGSLLALLPGAISRGIVGDSLTKILMDPTPETYAYLAGGIALWIVMIWGTHLVVKRFQGGNDG